MIQAARFWDKTADRYSKSPIKNEAVYQKKLAITRSYFQRDMNVLEIACGTGSTAISLAPYVKYILAIDISPRMLDIARQKAQAVNVENVLFEETAIENFNKAGKAFDAVMAHSILHLLDAPEQVIAKVYNLLKPGGVFITSTVCLGDSMMPWKMVAWLARCIGVAPYVNILKREELESLFLKAGFKIDFQREPQKKEAAFIVLKKPRFEN